MINFTAIYVLWLREMKRYIRAKSRIVGTLIMPLFFLAFLGLGLTGIALPGISEDISYLDFLVPGIVGMSVLFASTFAGVSVLWDREFGFLKEIMVAPVNRLSIALGRIAGGTTIALIQGVSVLAVSLVVGFEIAGIMPVLLSLVFMMLIAGTFIGLGLVIASRMRDIQGLGTIVNFIIFTLFFLSG
jgi:ABC-2 type transport system permease protein